MNHLQGATWKEHPSGQPSARRVPASGSPSLTSFIPTTGKSAHLFQPILSAKLSSAAFALQQEHNHTARQNAKAPLQSAHTQLEWGPGNWTPRHSRPPSPIPLTGKSFFLFAQKLWCYRTCTLPPYYYTPPIPINWALAHQLLQSAALLSSNCTIKTTHSTTFWSSMNSPL